jgi:hypothetical protein
MFRTCIYCNHDLGSNQAIENFPVGRRLAFDQDRGRLWVICERCRRWNLTPIEERWEAIEECEKQYYDTPSSFSTDNIGMAMLAEGTQLVRIGRPKRREFAAWRYGREFLRRRVASTINTAVQVGIGVGAMILGANILPVIIGLRNSRVIARVRDEYDRRLFITPGEVRNVKFYSDGSDARDWQLEVPYRPNEKGLLWWKRGAGKRETTIISGAAALRAAGRLLPHVNEYGGSDAEVRQAVLMIEEARSPERLFAQVAPAKDHIRTRGVFESDGTVLRKMDRDVRLAMEMAAHENTEQLALEGELAVLEAAWREAEEVASIADRLMIPDKVEALFLKFKREIRA